MRLTIRDIQNIYTDGVPLVMLTAYDVTSARVAEAADIPMILVGDTLGMVMQGHTSPVPVKLEHEIYHCEIVVRMTERPFIIGDMPFMTYSINPEQAMTNAARIMQEAGASAVKMEGGEWLAPTIQRVVQAGIPVMGHIGLMPQSVNKIGGFRLQGKDVDSARQLLRDAKAVQDAGAFALVIESIPAPLTQMVTEELHIPTIGIGAGPHCDGQVQVFHDILGLFEDFVPRHTKQYAQLGAAMRGAIEQYASDVKSRHFPTDDNSFKMNEEVLAELRADRPENGATH